MSNRVIHLSNVSKRYGDFTAVKDINFSVKRGEVVGFVGPNGAGKTTTISLLLGFQSATKGTVRLYEEPILPSTAHRTHRRIGYAAGDMAFFDNLTGEQYLEFMAHRFGINIEIRARLDNRLSPQLHTRLKQLSRGNKQKIGLIAALQHDPELIILDEPTSGLDPLMQETFLTLIREEAERGATVFMSSHILSEVAAVCSRVIFMKKGRIVSDTLVSEIEQSAGKLIRISGSEHEIKLLLATIPDAVDIESSTETSVILQCRGDIHLVLRWLASKRFADISIEDRQLDDLFLDLYQDEEHVS